MVETNRAVEHHFHRGPLPVSLKTIYSFCARLRYLGRGGDKENGRRTYSLGVSTRYLSSFYFERKVTVHFYNLNC